MIPASTRQDPSNRNPNKHRENTHNFAHNGLDQLDKGELLLVGTLGDAVVDVLGELGDDLGVRVRLEDVATTLKEGLELGVVGDDAVVDLFVSRPPHGSASRTSTPGTSAINPR